MAKLYPPPKANASNLPMAAVNNFLESLFPPTWRDKLFTAAFRGIPFCVKKNQVMIGRRTKVTYNYPSYYTKAIKQEKGAFWNAGSVYKKPPSTLKYAKGAFVDAEAGSDIMDVYPYVYDIGLEVLEYKIEGYLIANDYNDYNYLDHKKLLMRAFAEEGPGTLIHPTLGQLTFAYIKGPVSFDEDTDEGGICRFTATFLRGREQVQVNTVKGSRINADDVGNVDLNALEAWLMALDKFATNINRLGMFASSMVLAVANTISRIANTVTKIAGALSSLVNNICRSLYTLANSINTLLDAPCDIAASFKTAADSIKNLAGLVDVLDFGGVTGQCSGKRRGDTVKLNGQSVPESLGVSIINEAIAAADIDESILKTAAATSTAGANYGATTSEQAENMTLVVNTFMAAVITTTLPIAIRINYTSQQKMEEMLGKLTALLDTYLLRLGEVSDTIDYSDMYSYFDNLKNIFITSMMNKYAGIAKDVDFTVPPDVYSSLVFAYDQYYDLSRSWEARDRNEPLARHPGFLPNGQIIKVLDS